MGLFVFVACQKKPLSWNSNYLFPVLEDELTLLDFVADSSFIEDSNGFIFDFTSEISRFDLNTIVALPDTNFQEVFSLPLSTTINPGFEFVNEIQNQNLNLPQIELKKVVASQGRIRLQLENPYETTVFYTLTIPGVSKDGVPFEITSPAAPGTKSNPSITSIEEDLEGYLFDLRGVNGDDFNFLQTQVTVQTDPNGPAVQSTPTHFTRITVAFEDVKTSYARGYFGQQVLTDTLVIDVKKELGLEGGQLSLSDLQIALRLINAVKVDGELTIHRIIGQKQGFSPVLLNHPDIGKKFVINRATGGEHHLNPHTLSLVFDDQNSNLVDFLEFLPDQLLVEYTFELNPNGNISGHFDEFFNTSFISFEAHILMPMEIGLHDFALTDTIDLNLENADSLTERILDARIRMRLENSFPVSLLADVELLDSMGGVVFEKNNIELRSSAEGVLNATDGMSYAESIVLLDLGDVLEDLSGVRRMKSSVRINTDSVVGATVQISPAQKVKIKGNVKLEFAHEYE